ncbi:hypothetical protein [Armatimonas sp.]|uniref:hypothetical protein n=1 Tax=Armatimonas sp. TaxID=1872638 RepID=UPI00374D31B9
MIYYSPALVYLLQKTEPPPKSIPLLVPGINLPWAMKIPLRYHSPREFDPLIGPIYYANRERITWPLRGGYIPGVHVDGAPVKGLHGPMRPPGIDNIVALEDGSLLVQGDPADIEELTALVHALDIPIPSVECRLDVVRGKQKVLSASASGKVGTVVKASNRVLGPATKAARIEMTFKVLPLGMGRYEIESQGSVSVSLAKSGMRLEKTFQSIQPLTPGQSVTLDRIELGNEVVILVLSLKN